MSGSSRQPQSVLQQAISSFENEGGPSVPQFLPSKTFTGAKPGYYFAMGHRGVGYYRDKAQAPPTHPPTIQSNQDASTHQPAAPSQPTRKLDAAALLKQAEDAAGDESVQFVDAKGLKKLVTNLERKYNFNLEQRMKYAEEPQRFLESEIELDEAVKSMLAVASSPELYPDLVALGAVPVLLGLLHHENGDIVADSIELLSELTDGDTIEDSEAEARVLVAALFEQGLMDLLVQRLKSLDESIEDEAKAVYNALGVVENAVEVEPEATEAASRKSGLLEWLLTRIKSTRKKGIDGNAQYASEILSVLLQAGEEARNKFEELDSVDVILQAVASFRNKEPSTSEEEEFSENLFDVLCLSLLTEKGKEGFVAAEGIELMLIILKGCKALRLPALKCIDYATTNCPAAANKCVEKGGLKSVFAAFMGRLKTGKKGDDSSQREETERCVSLIGSLLRFSTEKALHDRVAAKFVENEFEKTDRLMEIFNDYSERVAAAEVRLAQEAETVGEEEENDLLLARLDAGLFTLQQATLTIAGLWALGDTSLRKRILMHLHQTGRTLGTLRTILLEYRANVGDGNEQEEQQQPASQKKKDGGGDEKERVMDLLINLGYKASDEKEGEGDGDGQQQDRKRPREEEEEQGGDAANDEKRSKQ